jgi:phospholipase D-like protein
MPWFWQAVLFVIFVVPVIVLFAYAAWDVIRRHDAGVGQKALWLILFCVLPIAGALIYLVIRPPGTTAQQARLADGTETAAGQLMALADLHDRGKLTDQEYEHAKAQHVGVGDIRPDSVREQRGGQLL